MNDRDLLQTANLQELREALQETTRDLLAANDLGTLRLTLNSQRPADLADLFGSLKEQDRRRALSVVAKPLAAAMFAAIVFSAVLGVVIPLLFRRVGVDPAVASGPLITTLNDCLSLGVYFTIAHLLLGAWG